MKPIATVINNNQPGWTNIVETEPNVTLSVGTKLYSQPLDATLVAGQLREHGNYTLGLLLTAVEAALGDSKQAEALKSIVRREMFALMDRNQASHYESLGMQEPGLAPEETHVDGQDELR